MKNQIPHLNLFMMCTSANTTAFCDLPDSYHFRKCRPNELDTWKYLSIKDPQHFDYMTEYYNQVYATNADLFFEKCLFACDKDDIPIEHVSFGRPTTKLIRFIGSESCQVMKEKE